MTHRPLEITLGVITLLSVISVPIPRSGKQRPSVNLAQTSVTYASRVNDLDWTAQEQQREIDSLMQETRGIADSLGNSPAVSSARLSTHRPRTEIQGTPSLDLAKISDAPALSIGTPLDAGFPEEEYGCTQ